jgi:hypothetical protein
MDKTQIDELAAKLDHLEAENRRLNREWRRRRVLGLVAAVAALGLLLLGADCDGAPREVEASRLVLKDKNAKARAVIEVLSDDTTALTLFDAEGKARALMSAAPTGGAKMRLMAVDGKGGVHVDVLPDGAPNLSLLDGQGEPRILLGVKPDGTSTVTLPDRDNAEN